MTGYSDITYEWLNPTGTLTHSLTWLFYLAAAISRPDPYHVVSSTGSKKLSALSGQKIREIWTYLTQFFLKLEMLKKIL